MSIERHQDRLDKVELRIRWAQAQIKTFKEEPYYCTQPKIQAIEIQAAEIKLQAAYADKDLVILGYMNALRNEKFANVKLISAP